jgi:hypothetical protein
VIDPCPIDAKRLLEELLSAFIFFPFSVGIALEPTGRYLHQNSKYRREASSANVAPHLPEKGWCSIDYQASILGFHAGLCIGIAGVLARQENGYLLTRLLPVICDSREPRPDRIRNRTAVLPPQPPSDIVEATDLSANFKNLLEPVSGPRWIERHFAASTP